MSDVTSQVLIQSRPNGSTGWTATVGNIDTLAHTFTIHAVCAPAASVTKVAGVGGPGEVIVESHELGR